MDIQTKGVAMGAMAGLMRSNMVTAVAGAASLRSGRNQAKASAMVATLIINLLMILTIREWCRTIGAACEAG